MTYPETYEEETNSNITENAPNTPEFRRRIRQAICETERSLERATRYKPEFQDKSFIAEYRAHLKKLGKMLEFKEPRSAKAPSSSETA